MSEPATLASASTAAEVVEAIARATWAKANDGAECPPERIPAPEDLSAWVAEHVTEEAQTEAAALLAVLVPPDWRDAGREAGTTIATTELDGDGAEGPPRVTRVADRVDLARGQRHLLVAGLTARSMVTDAPALYADLVEWAHWLRLALPEPRPRHPLAPLVADWQEHAPVTVEPDRHPRGILPAALRDVRRDQAVLPLALDRETPLGPAPGVEAGYLPGLEPAPSLVPAVPWLTLYDLTGAGPIQTRGRGAPLAQRLFVEVLTAVPRDGREWTAATPVTLRNLFAWLWAEWYDAAADRMRGGYNRSKHLAPLVRALIELDNMRFVLPGDPAKLARRLIRVDDVPTAGTALDDVIRFHVRHLPGSDHGPMFQRPAARRWGLASAPAWRSTIRLAYLWDEAKARNGGRRIYATRPVVARVGAPGSPLLGPDGKPLRDRRGAVVTDWSDRRAVILGADGKPTGAGNPPAFERNPAADRVPELGPDDLIRLAFDDHLTRTNRRERLRLARAALAAMEAAGEIIREPDGHGGERIIEARRTDPATC